MTHSHYAVIKVKCYQLSSLNSRDLDSILLTPSTLKLFYIVYSVKICDCFASHNFDILPRSLE